MAVLEDFNKAYKIYVAKLAEGKELLKDIPQLYAHNELTKCYDLIYELKGQGISYEAISKSLGRTSHTPVYSILRAHKRLIATANSLGYLVRIAKAIQEQLGLSPMVLSDQEESYETIDLEPVIDPVYRRVANEIVVTLGNEVFRFRLNEDHTDIVIDTNVKYPKWIHKLWSDKKFNDFVRSSDGED
jgi:hypothetical protein